LNLPPMLTIIEDMKRISVNNKARFQYELFDHYKAGLVLQGTEVKSLREGRGSITQGFGRVTDGEVWLYGMDIPPYEAASIQNHDPKRARKLLLHKKEIKKLLGAVTEKGFTLVPLSLYFEKGWAKVDIAVAKGKTMHDKRERIKSRDAQREMQKAQSNRRR
jgi:SsrA-binding protein